MSLEISKPEIQTYYIARAADGSVVHDGVINENLIVTTGLEVLETNDNENDYLNALGPYADKFPPLPAQGGQVNEGQLYAHAGGVVMARQSHTRTEHDPATVPALFASYQMGAGNLDWIENEQVSVGTIRDYQGQLYRCIQAHQTQSDWTPPAVPALWQTYTAPGQTWVDSGETVTSLIGAGVIGVSDTTPFGIDQEIRILGTEATVSSIFTPGAPGVLVISPHIAVSGGDVIEVKQ